MSASRKRPAVCPGANPRPPQAIRGRGAAAIGIISRRLKPNCSRSTLHRWQSIKSRLEPGDHLTRFTSELQSPAPVLRHGGVWQRGKETLSGFVTHTESIAGEDEWIGEQLRFATPEEIAACPVLCDQVRPR